MNFGQALEALKANKKATRSGWNGTGMWIALSPGFTDLPAERIWNDHIRQEAESHNGTADFRPYLIMRTAQGDFVPWIASQSDILADDWTEVA